MRPSALAPILLAAGLGGCAPTYVNHGFMPQIADLETVEPGTDTRGSVLRKLGQPSTLASFDQDTWFYIASRSEKFAFYAPQVVERTVVAVRFDETGLVSDVARYGLEDGEVVALIPDTTPTYGRELTFLQQVFGNIGNVDAEQVVNPNSR
jgi:outer membrane protein assembly factor BamE (lipoprotein component of BamABCDE complex)